MKGLGENPAPFFYIEFVRRQNATQLRFQ